MKRIGFVLIIMLAIMGCNTQTKPLENTTSQISQIVIDPNLEKSRSNNEHNIPRFYKPKPVAAEVNKPVKQVKRTTSPVSMPKKITPTPTNTSQDNYNKPYSIYIMGKVLTYRNGGRSQGQSIINSSPNTVSTWGGANPWSGTDNMNTHFIAHNYGAFKGLGSISIGSTIVVTDSKGTPTRYKVTRKFIVNHNAVGEDGKDYWDYIVGTGGGEVITLQTCRDKTMNWIVRAEKF